MFLADGEREEDSLTFAGLDRRARALAHILAERGARDERVLLLFPPGIDFISAFFGCLYARAVAVPTYPPRMHRGNSRLESIRASSTPALVLTTASLLAHKEALCRENPGLAGLAWIAVEDVPDEAADAWQPPVVGPDTLAFLQYTSGSTSAPKGVMVSHGNLLANEEMIRHACRHDERSDFVSWLPMYHDMGLIGSVLQPLYVGASCVLMAPSAFLQRPMRWLQAISRYRAHTSGAPNFAYDLCVRKGTPEERAALDLSSWRIAFNGAEPVRRETLELFAETFAASGFRRETFFPCYGLAEATLIVSGADRDAPPTAMSVHGRDLEAHRIVEVTEAAEGEAGARSFVSCGAPILDQQVAIVEPDTRRRCGHGEVGEIWVAGDHVAQGYWDLPELSAEVFEARIQGEAEPRYLRTGDLGFLSSNELYVTGRLKDLVILRGANHYPQDLERTAERQHPALRAGCSAAFAVDADGEERLVIAVEVDRRFAGNPEELAVAIRQAVVEEHDARVHTVALIQAGTIPKTSSGKIQRRACRDLFLNGALEMIDGGLQAPFGEPAVPAAAESEVVAFLREQVAKLAGIPPAAADPARPLAALGVDSLGAVELGHRIEERFGVLPGLAYLMDGPALNDVADWIAGADGTAADRIEPAGEEEGDQPLSYGQRALWFLQQLDPADAAYNIPVALRVHGALDLDVLEEAAGLVARRHSLLRSSFHPGPNGPVRRVHRRRPPEILRVDASEWTGEELRERLEQEAWRPFDLEGEPLFRLAVFRRRDGDEHTLLLTVHHLVADLWSLAILKRDLDLACQYLQGGTAGLPPLPRLRYADYAGWQARRLAGADGERLWEFWRERLSGELQETTLLPDRPRNPRAPQRGGAMPARLDAGTSGALRRLAQNEGMTLSTVLLTGFLILLHRCTGQDDLLIGMPTDGRDRPELSDLVGYLVNPTPLRADLSGDPGLRDLLAEVRGTALAAFEHREMPFPLLVERLQPERDASRSPLFQTLFAFQRSPLEAGVDLGAFALGTGGAATDLAGLRAESVGLESRAVRFDLELIAAEAGDGIGLSLRYDGRLFDRATLERFLGHLRHLLSGAAADPDRTLSALPLWSAEEIRQLTSRPAPEDPAAREDGATIHGLFQAQARRTPDAMAVVAGDESLTYRELAERAGRLARHLVAMGVEREEPVAVCLDRRAHLPVALLAVLEAGGAYVPIDPAYPRERQDYLLRDSGARRLVTRSGLLRDDLEAGIETVLVEGDIPEPGPRQELSGRTPAGIAGLAYLIYTSGSTGRPKGVAIEHGSAVALIRWALDVFPAEALARTVASTSVCFDLSVFELFAPLACGGTVMLVDDALALPAVAGLEPTLLNTVPSALTELLRQGALPPSVRTVNLAGEPLRRALVEAAYATGTVQRVFNLYGPSEDTTYSTWALVPPGADLPVTIGRPVTGTRTLVLDGRMQPSPWGAAGELYLGGAGLARGYFRRPDLTAERFVPDPFAAEPGGRLYRTGDRVRLRADGELEYLGRLDHQVKIRGFRIEPGEVESILLSHPAVREALVAPFEARPGDLRLTAWVAAQETAESLRPFLQERLPEFMIPTAWVFLPALPHTPSGKVDRKALPAPELGRVEGGAVAPRGEVEELLAGIWAEVLGSGRVGSDARFFDLGGHSLLAAQVVSRVRQALRIEIPLRAFFEEPTLADLARRIESSLQGDAAGVPVLAPMPPGEPEASYPQQRLWFLYRLDPEAPTYNMPGLVRLRGPISAEALEAALNGVALRQESLRTRFHEKEGKPVPEISAVPDLRLVRLDLGGLGPVEREESLERLAGEEARQPFDLERGPLARATLVRLEDADHALLLTLHHAIADGWSQAVLAREVSVLYRAALRGQVPTPPPLPPLQVSYTDFARWQRAWLESGEMERQLAYWRERLGGSLPPLELPLDHPRPPVLSSRGGRRAFALEEQSARALRNLSQRHGTTLFMTLLAGFQAVLHRMTGQTDFALGTTVAHRRHREVEDIIGLFVNVLALRSDLGGSGGSPAFGDLLARARETTLDAWAHQELPFERLVDELQPARDQSRPPLFQAMLTLQNVPAPRLDLEGTAAELHERHSGTSKFELSLSLGETETGLQGFLEYATDLFDPVTAERLLGYLRHVLEGAAADPGTPLAALPLLSEAEHHQVALEWNDRKADVPAGTIHGLVEAQAARTPGAVALEAGDERLTYRELVERSHRLAHHLRSVGVGPETPVAVLLERRAELVVSLLAILQAGGAYVPIDPKYPRERQALILEDSGASVLLSRGEDGPTFAGVRVCLDSGLEAVEACPPTEPEPWAGPGNLAYLIYTSGSTGRPKGVAIEHRSAVALLHWARQAFSDDELSGVLASTSVCFDLSVFELFAPLAWGGRAILVEDGLTLLSGAPPDGLTLINTVPSVAAELLRSSSPALPATVRTVCLAGEPLRRSLVDRLYGLDTVKRVWNLYGPSEDTTYSTGEIVPDTGGEPTLGRSLAGRSLLVLDSGFRPVPVGVAGEICLGGAGLSRGYQGRPDLTAERFVPNPLAAAWDEPGGRLYRSGDLGRLRRDGTVELLGRIDHQVKVRGFRVELGEIEAVLSSHPSVRECAAAAPEMAPGDRRLVAYLVWEETGTSLSDLAAHLRARLPQALVPTHFVELEALPLTPNGKVDRGRLPLPEESGLVRMAEPAAPRTSMEAELADLWREVLGAARVGVHDNFFELGGHSLLAARLMSRLGAAFEVEIPLRALFDRPTVAGLAARIEEIRQSGEALPAPPPLRPLPRDGALPLSFAQERLWVMDRLLPGSPVYNVFHALRLSGPLDPVRLQAAFAHVVRRHEVLRTAFPPVSGDPVQVIQPERPLSWEVLDLTHLPAAERETRVQEKAVEEARTPFDLDADPLLRLRLLVLDPGDHVLLLTLHHIVCDDWSIGVLVREVTEAYGAALAGRAPRLPDLPVQYGDFAVWQREWLTGDVLDKKLAYWKAHLGTNPPVLALPTDRPRPPVQTFRGSGRRVRMPEALAAGLRSVARAEGATLFMTLLAGYAALLSRAAGQPEVVVGCASANRDRMETEGLIGFFVNILPLRLDLRGCADWRELLRRVRTAALGGYDHADLPFEKLVAAVQPRRDLSHAALRQVGFAFENHPSRSLELAGGVTSRPLEVDTGVARLDLTLFLWEEEGGELAGICEYNTDLFDAATVDRFLERFEAGLTTLAGGAGRPLPELAARVALPLSQIPESNLTSSQLLFWFAHSLNPDVQLYFDLATTTYEVEGALDEGAFRQAFQRLVDHCDALRSTIHSRSGIPMRVVLERLDAPLELVDLSAEADPAAAYAAWLDERCRRRISLEERLFDGALVRLAPDRHVWFWNVHHIIADAGSLVRIAEELSSYYGLALQGRLDETRPLPSYQRYVDYERELRGSRRWERAREHWERKLSAPWSRSQFYRRDPGLRTTRARRHTVNLGEAGSQAVRDLTAQHALFSPAVVFATVLFSLLHRLSGERILRIGTPFANRSDDFSDVVGLQMNACPLQVRIEDGETFLSLAHKLQQETVETAKWQFYPVRNPVESPVYDVYYNYQNVSFREFCGLPVAFDLINSGHTHDLLDLQVRDFRGRGIFDLDLDLNEAAFDAAQGTRTVGHFLRLLEAFREDAERPLSTVEMLGPDERRRVVEEFNATAVEYPVSLLHGLVEAQVERTPDAEAVAFEGERISYRELDRRANRLAWRLREMGVGPDVPVGVFAERSIEMVVALLGILKAGGAYLPLDPGYPAERVSFMATDARVPVILTQSRLAAAVPEAGAAILRLDGDWPDISSRPDRSPETEVEPSNLAYVIFTSGSTGRPKGAMLTHSGICNRLLWMQDSYRLTSADRVLQKTPFSFDVSVWELFWPLMTGATLVMARPEGHRDPAYLSHILHEERITTLHFVPSMLQAFLASPDIGPCGSLRRVLLSGEALPEELRRRFYERLPEVDLHNLYGPTEASVDVTFWACPRNSELSSVPIGRPIANTQIYLIDPDSNPVPFGAPGELAIGGVSLARGYLGRPGLTAERFVPDPFANVAYVGEPGSRLYRTGDLARHLPGGEIEYLGRLDHQVKIRGFRIELGEIEAAVARHPGVRETVVLAREDRPGDPRLVAYVVGDAPPGAADLRELLKDSLPEYMLPTAVVVMGNIPLTPSGKVDRRALPPPGQANLAAHGEHVAPRTPLEALLANIWAEVLGVEQVGVHDSFFDLGGNSLAATRAVTLVQEVLPVELLLRNVFESPTVARIAAHLEDVTARLGAEEQQAMEEVLAEFELLMAGEQGELAESISG